MRLSILACSLLLAAAQARPADAQQPPDSLARVLQSFLDWYVPLALGDHQGPAWTVVLGQQNQQWRLSLELKRVLRADSAAQARAHGVIVGLDFDPFLNSQDPREHYEVGAANRSGRAYFVDIYGIRAGTREDTPVVVVEVLRVGGRWVFVNFHYPREHTDLLRVLRRLHH